ncbi:nuclear transport factor 2 family protein [Flagellimonas sp. HMM57]|uniref:YybH family protein n=1 Tax=unclassified Flagellimonas TaxID=2644544 RepID=UPI0013D37806|nr:MULTISPECIES: nuclear transport factor 2 family protein [unclassified Flagellimonas]UII77326.1 nuclear transport factor 2 family protein [Flagellimonas sp. HMM57]
MRTKRALSIIVLLSLNFYACNHSGNTKKTIPNLENDHSVKALFLSTIEGFNQGNLKLFLANFSDEIHMYGTDGNYVGKEALRKRFAKLFQKFPNMKMEIPELKLKMLSEKVVLVDFQWKLYPMGQGPKYSGIGTGIYLFENDSWSEILEIERTMQVDKELIP